MHNEQNNILYFSSILRKKHSIKQNAPEINKRIAEYGLPESADDLFKKLKEYKIKYKLLYKTKDIWARDFMPVKTGMNTYVSFRYYPSYLKWYKKQRTDFMQDLQKDLPFSVTPSPIILDGGNVVFSPKRTKAIIGDRVFLENSKHLIREKEELVRELEKALHSEVIIIPSYNKIKKNVKKKTVEYEDPTGHADGMVRFISENTVVGNKTTDPHEDKIKSALSAYGITVEDFPYLDIESPNDPKGENICGCYINYLETDEYIFLPQFIDENSFEMVKLMDTEAIKEAKRIWKGKKTIVPVNFSKIAQEGGGVLNCISWEL